MMVKIEKESNSIDYLHKTDTELMRENREIQVTAVVFPAQTGVLV